MSDSGMKPIWYFVGLMLSTMGAVILISGVYRLVNPGDGSTVLAEIHPDVWWGAVMTLFGGILYWKTRKHGA
jgi:hypothetical protein